MRKVQLLAVVWTLFLAIPFTALALSGLAYTTEHMYEIRDAISAFETGISVGGRGLLRELSARWPEIAGMIIGQLVILTTLLFAKRNQADEDEAIPEHQ